MCWSELLLEQNCGFFFVILRTTRTRHNTDLISWMRESCRVSALIGATGLWNRLARETASQHVGALLNSKVRISSEIFLRNTCETTASFSGSWRGLGHA